MKCEICQREYSSRRRDSKTCSMTCRMERNRRTARAFIKANPRRDREWKEIPPPTRRQREMMMEGLHRLLFTTGDEVSLVFGQAQDLGRGLKCRGSEALL